MIAGEVAALQKDFQFRQIKVAALSCNDADMHREWVQDIEAYTPGARVDYPIIADPDRQIAVLYVLLTQHLRENLMQPYCSCAVY